MQGKELLGLFQTIGEAFNSPLTTVELMGLIARSMVETLDLKGCHFRLLSRDQKTLEHIAAHGLSERFLNKGPVDAERSVAEALKGNTVMVLDCASDPRIQYPRECVEEGIASVLTVPLRTRGQVIGVIRLFTKERRKFTQEEIEIIQVVALFCTCAVIHSMFHAILGQVTSAMRSSLDLEDVLDSIVRAVTENLRCKGCTIRLWDAKTERLEVRAAYGLSEEYLAKIREQTGTLARQALTGTCVPVPDARHDARVLHVDEVMREHISSMLYVPLMCRDTAVGVLCVYTHLPYEFSEDEIHLLTSIGEQCALVIRNAQMYAAVKRRHDTLVDEFQQWFEHYCVFPARQRKGPE